jgi:hypothetical protein
MNIVKLEVGIDIDDPKQMEVMNSFLTGLRGLKGEEVTITGKISDAAKVPTASAPKVEAQATKQTVPAAINPGGGKGIDYIRKLIGEKSGVHREAMKKKLTELGAATATDLTVDKYQEFTEFLEALS